jgi:hypothetical protein
MRWIAIRLVTEAKNYAPRQARIEIAMLVLIWHRPFATATLSIGETDSAFVSIKVERVDRVVRRTPHDICAFGDQFVIVLAEADPRVASRWNATSGRIG